MLDFLLEHTFVLHSTQDNESWISCLHVNLGMHFFLLLLGARYCCCIPRAGNFTARIGSIRNRTYTQYSYGSNVA